MLPAPGRDVGTAWIAAVLTQVLLALSSKSLSRAGHSYGHDCWPRSPGRPPSCPGAFAKPVRSHCTHGGAASGGLRLLALFLLLPQHAEGGLFLGPSLLVLAVLPNLGRLNAWFQLRNTMSPHFWVLATRALPPLSAGVLARVLRLGPHPVFSSLQLSSLLSYSRRRPRPSSSPEALNPKP